MTATELPLSPSATRDDGVDGLRALAMTMVVAQHCGLLPFGWTGVWLFYVISGYVIALGFDRPEAAALSARARVAGFWRRRVARLLPAYAAYLLINVAVLLAIGRLAPLADLPWLLAFVHNWHMSLDLGAPFSGWPPFGHLWTLSVEQQFYVVYPLFVLLVPTRWRGWACLALIAAAPGLRMAWAQVLVDQGLPEGKVAFGVYAASHVQVDAFLMGCLLARFRQCGTPAPQGRTLSNALWALAVLLCVGYALTYVQLNQTLRGQQGMDALRDVFSGVLRGQHREAWVYTVVSVACAALVWHVVQGRLGTVLLSAPRWVAIGRASYSGYLVHLLLLWAVGEALDGKVKEQPMPLRLLAFALVWSLTVVVSRWSWRWLEQPAGRWLSRPPITETQRGWKTCP